MRLKTREYFCSRSHHARYEPPSPAGFWRTMRPMGLGVLLLALLLGSIVYGLSQFLRAEVKSRQAVHATAYIVAYPLLALAAWHGEWLPAWLVAPLVLAGVPWIVAGIYLNEIVKDPGLIKPDEFVGFPRRFWIWGGLAAVILGLILG